MAGPAPVNRPQAILGRRERDRGLGGGQVLRAQRGTARNLPCRGARRGVRAPGPKRRRQDDHRRDSRGLPHPRRPEEVIELVGLTEKIEARVRTLSGGQLRRLDLALALVGDPELIFLDEPTTGFDPAARRQAWDTIRGLRELGKSILLTTHYMEEAQRLSDRIAILGD